MSEDIIQKSSCHLREFPTWEYEGEMLVLTDDDADGV